MEHFISGNGKIEKKTKRIYVYYIFYKYYIMEHSIPGYGKIKKIYMYIIYL